MKPWHYIVLGAFAVWLWRSYGPCPDTDGTAPDGVAQSVSDAFGVVAAFAGFDSAAGLDDTLTDSDDLGTAADGSDASLGGDDGGIGSYLG